MSNFTEFDKIKTLFNKAIYINLSTIREDGTPHPSTLRISHGQSLSLYFLSEQNSEKSKNIQRDPRVSGSIMIDIPKAGAGVTLYFNGIAHMVSQDDVYPNLAPVEYPKREAKMKALCLGRKDYAANMKDILSEETDIRLHRIMLTRAWYNGGIYKEDSSIENNATRDIKIAGEGEAPFLRRFMVLADKPLPRGAVEFSDSAIIEILGLPSPV